MNSNFHLSSGTVHEVEKITNGTNKSHGDNHNYTQLLK